MLVYPLKKSGRIARAGLSAVALASLSVLSTSSLHATAYGLGTSGDWVTAATWSPTIAGGPTSTDTISATGLSSWAVNLGGNRTIASIGSSGTGSTGQFDFLSSASGVNLLTVTGNISKTQSTGVALRFLDGATGTIQLNVGGTVIVSAGTLVLSGNNTITGGTTISGTGALQLNNVGALGTSMLTLSGGFLDNTSGAALTLSGNNPVTLGGNFTFTGSHDLNLGSGAVTLSSARTITLAGTASTLTFGGVLTNGTNGANSLTVNGAGNTVVLGGLATASQSTAYRTVTIQGTGNTTITGAITDGTGTGVGGGGLTKDGTGVLTLMAASTHNGATAVNGGVLNIRDGDALGTTTGGTTVAIGATLQLQGDITTGAETLGLRGTGASGQTGALVNVSGTNNYAGLISLGDPVGATISSDSGTLNLTNTGTLDGGSGAARPLTLGGAGNGSVASILGSKISTVTKTGTGSWTLSSANIYTGTTTVSGGKLTIASTGTINSTSGVSIGEGEFNYNSSTALSKTVSFSGTGGTLSGTGTITPAVTITAGNTISPGNATGTGTLTLGALDAAGGATFNFSLGTASDLLAVTGALTGSTTAGALTFNFANAGSLAAGHTYTLLTFGSQSGLDYIDFTTGSIASSFVLDSSFGTGGWLINADSLQVQFAAVAAVPEPSTETLFLGGVSLLCVTMSRRRSTPTATGAVANRR